MCSEVTLVPIPDLLWESGAVHNFDASHPEYGINDDGERCLAIDSCIVPAVKALWSAGVVTMACCCGHGDPWGVVTIQTEQSKGRTGAMVIRVEEYDRLREQLRIATDLLERLASQRGLDMRRPGEHATLAEDALIQMSVVEPAASQCHGFCLPTQSVYDAACPLHGARAMREALEEER